jgi:glycosyltransferase involved in cell wall biosynthesis
MPRSPFRVTHVVPEIGIGGAETQLAHLISRTPPQRASHRVLYYSDSHDEEGLRLYARSGIRLERVARSRALPALFLWRLAKALREDRPDVVHCWLPGGAFWGRWAATLAGARRIVLSIRSSTVERVGLLQVSRLADDRRIHYLVNSSAAADTVVSTIGAPRDRVTIIPNGIEFDHRTPPLPRESLLKLVGGPADAKIVLTVGRLTEIKNYPMLLRLAALGRDRLPVRYFVAGHGELEASLKALSGALGVEDLVCFLGLRMDVPALLAAADLFCYTSRSEGMPNALLEAMAAARPIVSTRFAGVEDLIEAGRTGLLVGQDDDQGAFEAVRGLIQDPAASARLGAAARQSVAHRFGMDRMVEATLSYYERILGGGD